MICKYIRVSSIGLDEKQQNQTIDMYLKKKGWIAGRHFRDFSASKGKKYDHELLKKLCSELSKSDVIVVSDASVISKSGISEFCEIIETCFMTKELKFVVCDVGFEIDFSCIDKVVEAQLKVMFMFSRLEREIIKSRTQSVIDGLKKDIERFSNEILQGEQRISLHGTQKSNETSNNAAGVRTRQRAMENENNQKFYKFFKVFEARNGSFEDNDRATNSLNWQLLADELNAQGIKTSTGLPFTSMRCRNTYRTIKKTLKDGRVFDEIEIESDDETQFQIDDMEQRILEVDKGLSQVRYAYERIFDLATTLKEIRGLLSEGV